ncbi:hypothetical protein CFOL_v3_20084 [Cephalotus follicularis]|uniref:Uncharacterized protein n=1 Tax=Cephalotus follicularis TaxID=3775 RepID=A0A1Q3C921_CEPFO|nr:hypothetical protein CFOL_v3_20084 [Cephalotus follicularis]
MYTYRESIVLGSTNCSIFKVNQILRAPVGSGREAHMTCCPKTAITSVMNYVKSLASLSFLVGSIALPMLVMLPWKWQETQQYGKDKPRQRLYQLAKWHIVSLLVLL